MAEACPDVARGDGGEGRRDVEEPDPQVVLAAAAGDVPAFESLVRAYQAPVWRFVTHLTGDRTLAEDVCQETFLRMFRHLDRFRAGSRFSTWLFSIAHNAAVDALRSQGRRARVADAVGRRAGRPAGGGDPSAAYELQSALASLPSRVRDALVVIEVLGFGYREAGVVLGVPEGTVKSRVFQARQRLAGWAAVGATDEM